MDEVTINSVWRTKSGRLALIVASATVPQMLWLDDLTGELTVSPIENRLQSKLDCSVQEFFESLSEDRQYQDSCPHCYGQGRVWRSMDMNECSKCGGEGVIWRKFTPKLLNAHKAVTVGSPLKADEDVPF